MTVEPDLSCEVSEGSANEKVELEEKSDLNSSLCDDQEKVDDVDEGGDENVCESGDSEVKEEGEGENGAYVMVGGGGDAVVDSVVHENVEHVEQEEGELESNEEKEAEIVEHEDALENEEELHGEITGNVEASGEGILSLEGEAEPVDDDGKNASVVDDDENVDIVDDEEKIDKNDGDDEKVENVNNVETNGNVGDDVEKIDNVDAVEKTENAEEDEKIENVDHDDKIEGKMKPDTPVEVECLPSESDQVVDLNAVQKVDEGESNLVAEIKSNQQNEKSESFEEVEKQVSQVMVSQKFEFEEIEDDVIVSEFSPPSPTKEDGVKLDMDTYVEDTDSIRKIGDNDRTPHESSEVTDEEVKGDVDSSYVFIDGTEAVSIESLEAKPVIGDMTNLGSVTQTEETQIYPHALLIGTLACGLPHYVPRALQPLNESSTKVSPSCSVVDNAKPGIGMANFFPDQSEYLPTGSSSDLESNEAVITVGDVYLESEEGSSSNRSNEESTPSSYGGTSDEKNGDEKKEKKSIFYYLIRVPRYFDDEIEEQIVHGQQQVEEMTRKRDAIREEIQAKKATCNVYRDKIEAAKQEEGVAYDARYVKCQEMESVQSMLNMINSAFMVEEIGDQIRQVQHRIEHETISLKEEKQLIRELKQLKSQHQQLRSNLHKQAETQPAIDQKEALEKRLKLLKEDLDSVRNEILRTEEITNAARKVFRDENEKLRNMQEQFRSADVLRQEAYACVQKLKKQLYEKNKYFRVYKDDARKAEEYKFTGDKEALNSHCVNQVEKVMELWNKNDDFRNEYVRLNRRSTWRRLHTSKVLSLGPDEPFIPWKVREKVVATRSSTVSTLGQGNSVSPFEHKRTEEKSTVKQNQNHQTIPKKETIPIVLENDAAIVSGKVEAEEKTEEANKQTEEEKELAIREEEAAAAKIREQLLLEERVKAKEAEERKRRNAEKALTRAELKAQKEAEQKEKERAKRERKKARKNAMKGTNENEPSAPSSEPTMPEPTNQVPEVEEKPPKIVSKRNQRPSVLAKQAKAKIAPPPLRNKNKKKMQLWMWVLMALIVVAAVIFLPNLRHVLYTHSKR